MKGRSVGRNGSVSCRIVARKLRHAIERRGEPDEHLCVILRRQGVVMCCL